MFIIITHRTHIAISEPDDRLCRSYNWVAFKLPKYLKPLSVSCTSSIHHRNRFSTCILYIIYCCLRYESTISVSNSTKTPTATTTTKRTERRGMMETMEAQIAEQDEWHFVVKLPLSSHPCIWTMTMRVEPSYYKYTLVLLTHPYIYMLYDCKSWNDHL